MSKKLAKQLIEIEKRLNKKKYKDVQTGALLAKLNIKIYFGLLKKSSVFRNIAAFFFFILNGAFRTKLLLAPDKKNSKLMFSKLADRPQCNKLIDPLYLHYTDSVLWKYYEPGDIDNIKGIKKVNLFQLPRLIYDSVLLTSNAKYYYNTISEVTFSDIFMLYFSGIVQLNNWMTFFNDTNIRLLIVDFDRDNKSSPMILAAKACGIKTLTMVHGVMDPSYGFYPVIADKILVWGAMQKKYLLDGGVDAKKICIVGNPISEKYKTTVSTNNNIREIGVGLNNKSVAYNKLLLENFAKYANENRDIKFIIKLHPSMIMLDWMYKLRNEYLVFFPFDKLSIPEFFNRIETLIVGTSGIGFEAVVNDVPVGVIKLTDSDRDNDSVMINDGKFPDVTSRKSFTQFLFNMGIKAKRESLLTKEKEFVLEKYYAAIGNDAVDNTISIINEKINS